MFQFLVGPKRRAFTIHSALVACQSPTLDKLVNGSFKEAEDGQAVLEAVGERTFVRFCQFAYTADYDESAPEAENAILGLLPDIKNHDTSQGETVDQEDYYSLLPRAKLKKKKRGIAINRPGFGPSECSSSWTKRAHQWSAFVSAQYLDSRPHRSYETPQNSSPGDDYAQVFLSHALLYTFADCYGISPLMELSIHKLHKTLVKFQLFEERIGDVVKLLRYCHEQDVPEALRSLVAQYAACQVESLWQSDAFQKLVAGSGELSVALVGSMLPRLD